MSQKPSTAEKLSISLPALMIAAARAAAAEDQRTVSGYIQKLINDDIARGGKRGLKLGGRK